MGCGMPGERNDLKGSLLNHWIEDLKNDRPPGMYPEVDSLSPEEIEDVLGLARFVKGNLYPSNAMPVDVYAYASELGRLVSQQRKDQIELNRSAIGQSESFGKLVSRQIGYCRIDRNALQQAVAIPRNALPEIETEQMPPHRLQVESMVRLLVALRLASTEVIDLVKRSAREWAFRVYSCGQTQLGRIDVSLTNEERQRLMEDRGDLDKELTRIDSYCERLLAILSTMKGDQDLADSHPADGGTWLHH